jgi:hypothetical protein
MIWDDFNGYMRFKIFQWNSQNLFFLHCEKFLLENEISVKNSMVISTKHGIKKWQEHYLSQKQFKHDLFL